MRQIVLATSAGECTPLADAHQATDLIKEPGNILWIDLEHPEVEDIQLLRTRFNFHPLAVEDALHRQQKPKVDTYDGYYFIVFYSVSYRRNKEDDDNHSIRARQVSLFAGPNYLVTVHAGLVPEIEQTVERWKTAHSAIGHSVASLVYALLDAIVDNYFPVIDHIVEHVEDLEEQIFGKFEPETLPQIFALKKDLLNMRRIVAPARDVMNILLRNDRSVFPRESLFYFQDVYDHTVRVTDSIDTYRDLLSSALDSYLSISSNNMNQTMRVLTSSSIILMSMALVSGIYGMNFKIIPELDWQNGYPFALILMGVVALALGWFFRKKGWL